MSDHEGGEPSPSRDPSPESDPDPAVERTSGLTLETCYRHPREVTGVHCTRCGRPICTECMIPAPVGYQCPECVAEAKRAGPRRRVSLRVGPRAAATRFLLVVNIGMFVVEVLSGAGGGFAGSPQRIIDLGALFPPLLVLEGQYWRLFSAMFLHANILHLAFNMYALYLFGSLLEDALGTLRFVAIYVLSGLLASVTSFAFGNPNRIVVGASGAIFGVLGAWAAYNFRRRGSALAAANLRTALMLVGINVVLGLSIQGIDNFAHLGGLVSGAAAGWLAEGFGPRTVRRYVQVGGFVGLAILGLALTAWRVSALSF